MKKKILITFGTRPEAIKFFPIIKELKNSPDFKTVVCVFRQHKEMLYQHLKAFNIKPDYDLPISISDRAFFGESVGILSKGKTAVFSAWGLYKFIKIIKKERPDILLVQGDTFTSFFSALIASYLKIKVGHVEAGLRTGDKNAPFPEEINRRLISVLGDIHFAPTEKSKINLMREELAPEKIVLTGNTAIDTMRIKSEGILKGEERVKMENYFRANYKLDLNGQEKLVLVTAHRRENFGEGLKKICDAILTLSGKHSDLVFVYSIHQNPNVRKTVMPALSGKPRIYLLDPLEYEPFIYLLKKSYLVLTDSGGIQEEVSFLGKPAVVMRDMTERSEGVEDGNIVLVGADKEKIVKVVEELLSDRELYSRMAKIRQTYGDGHAAGKIIVALKNFLG